MDVEAALKWCDEVITEVDLELYQWTTDLDMMSFIGQEIPLRLWTHDDPPIVMELTNFTNTLPANKPVRVMHHVDGEWTQVGTAEIDPKSGMLLGTLTQEVPELTEHIVGGFSIHDEEGPFAHFHINRDGDWKQMLPLHPPFEGINRPVSRVKLDEIRRKVSNGDMTINAGRKELGLPVNSIENHPFFRTQNGPDTHLDEGN